VVAQASIVLMAMPYLDFDSPVDKHSSKRQARFFCFRQTDHVCQYWESLRLSISVEFFQRTVEAQQLTFTPNTVA
jgi:hypothetical protein